MRPFLFVPTLAILSTCATQPTVAGAIAGPPAAIEGDADTDVDTDADPMCSMSAPSIAWEAARPGEEATVRIRLRSDWDCAALDPALHARCEALKETGIEVWGADPEWYRSGADDPTTTAVVRQLPPQAFVAFGS